MKLYLPPPHFPSVPLQPQVGVGVIVLATHKKQNTNTLQSSKKHKSYSQVAKIGKTYKPIRGRQQFSKKVFSNRVLSISRLQPHVFGFIKVQES